MARSVMRTLLFAVHHPSQRTTALLKRSMRCYTQACRLVAEGAERDWAQIEQDALYNGRLSTLSLERSLRVRYGARVAPQKYPLHSSAREAVFADIAAALASYAALCKAYDQAYERALAKIAEAGYSLDPPSPEAEQILAGLGDRPSWPSVPVVRPRYDTYEATLDTLRTLGPGVPKPAVRLSEALAHGSRPLFFPRADGCARNRNFGLLRTEGHTSSPNGKRTVHSRTGHRRPKARRKRVLYRAVLYLLPGNDHRMRPLALPPGDDGWDPLVPLQPVPEGLTRKRLADVAPSLLSAESLRTMAPALTQEQAAHVVQHGLSRELAEAWQAAGLPAQDALALLAHEDRLQSLLMRGVTKERAQALTEEGVPATEAEAMHKADAGRQQVLALMAEGLPRSTRPSPALLLPLECGKWHERTLDLALHHPEMVRAARLVHRPARIMAGGRHVPEKFFIAVTFEHPVPELRITDTYMGVSMDESARVGYFVRDAATGRELAQGTLEDLWGIQEHWRQRRRAAMAQGKLPPRQHHRQREQVRHAVHKIVNAVLDVADQYSAQVAITDVRYLRTRRPYLPRDPQTGKRPSRSDAWHEVKAEAAYRRACLVVGDLERIFNYKCLQKGLPQALSIGGISPRDCAHCGGRGEETELCSRCGEVLGAKNTAHVTANRIPVTLEKIREARAKRKKQRDEQNGRTGDEPEGGPT